MKLSLPNDVYIVRETGLPVEGRMKVYLHESDTYADVYTLDGQEYVQAENPQLLHAGLPEATLFTDTGVYDIVIEQYIGQEGGMSVESPDEDFSRIDEFQWGLDFDPDSHTANRVDTIDELRSADPSLGAVTVSWYSAPGDCFPRTYWWDGASVNDEDGGYVIASDVSDTGRWILMWGEPVLPASVYGVSAADTSNINLLLNYPATVGSFALRTATAVRFPAGTYSTGVDYATSKDLVFDTGAKFTSTLFSCPRAIVPGSNTDYVADFSFTGDNVEAHSSWFRTVNSWWKCGAHTMFIDQVNHFANTALPTAAELLDTVLVGNTRIPTVYVNGSYIRLRNCTVLGRKVFAPGADYLVFANMTFTTDWFTSTAASQYDFGPVTAGHRIDARTANGNVLEFSNFGNPNVYYSACLANGDTSFDGHGATYPLLTENSQFTSMSNLTLNTVSDTRCETWKDVTVNAGISFGNSGPNTVTMEGCSFYLSGDLPTRIQTITVKDCDVRSGGKWRTGTRISVTGSTWAATCELPETAKTSRARAQLLSFERCVLSMGGNHIWTNYLNMAHCTSNAHVYLVPYLGGSDFRMEGTFVDNLFTAGALIECAPKDMAAELDVTGVHAALTFKENRFRQEDPRGIVMPWLTAELDPSRPFLDSDSVDLSVYSGNSGKCPAERPTDVLYAANMVGSSLAPGGLHYLPPATYAQRVWYLYSGNFFYPGLHGIQFTPSGDSWNRVNGRDAAAHSGALLHVCRVSASADDNDQFLCVHAWEDNDGFGASLEVFYF